jgi:hypothetical protein
VEKQAGVAAEESLRGANRYPRRCLVTANSTSQFNLAVHRCDIFALRLFLGSIGFWRNVPANQAGTESFQRMPFLHPKYIGALGK